jgi:hypothetical protein
MDIRELDAEGCITLEGKHHPIYIYNASKYPIPYSADYDRSKYDRVNIDEHLAGKVLRPLKSITQNLKTTVGTNTPINNVYGAISEGFSLFNISSLIGGDQKFILERHKNDKTSAFIEDGFLYIIPERNV